MKQRKARQKAEDIIEDLQQQIHYYTSILHSDVGGAQVASQQSSAKKMISDVHTQQSPSKFNALKTKLHQAEQEVKSTRERLAQYSDDIAIAKSTLTESQLELTRVQTTNVQLSSECRSSRSEIERLVQRVKSLEAEVSALRKKESESLTSMINQKHVIDKSLSTTHELQGTIGTLEKKLKHCK